MKKVVPALVAAAFLGLPATASAKEAREAVVCGKSECTTVTDRNTLRAFVQAIEGRVPTGRDPSGSYYTVQVAFVDGERTHRIRFQYDAATNMIQPSDGSGVGWVRMPNRLPAAFVDTLDRVEPLAPATESAAKSARNEHATPSPADDDGLAPWLYRSFAVAGAAAVIATAVVARRRRPAEASR